MTTPLKPEGFDLPVVDFAEARRRLVGLADPFARVPSTAGERGEIAETAIRFTTILAHLYGESLDDMTKWSRIDSALEQACAKVSDADLDRWVSLCLEHVKADPVQVATCGALAMILDTFDVRPDEWRQAFTHHVSSRRYALVVKARSRWQLVKSKEVEL